MLPTACLVRSVDHLKHPIIRIQATWGGNGLTPNSLDFSNDLPNHVGIPPMDNHNCTLSSKR